MSGHFIRGTLLISQRRYDLAVEELRLALAEDPQNPQAHAFLGICLAELGRYDEAQREAGEGIALTPDLPLPHYAMAVVLMARRRYEEALRAVEEAVRLDPGDADHHCLHAQVLFALRRWPDALAAAERGLQADGEHVACTNFRAMALIKLGRKSEAGHTLEAALARDPEDALSHANQGWALVEQGDIPKALEHFREALRLDPEMEYARAGIVEALKARHFVYRWLLRYFLWMNRLSGKAQWGIIIGGYLGYRLVGSLADANPAAAPFLRPVVWAYVAFAALTWLAHPLFNLLLRLNRFGRLALSRDQTVASNAVGACLFLAFVSLALSFLVSENFLLAAAFFGLLLLPIAGTFRVPEGWPRRVMFGVLGLFLLMGLVFCAVFFKFIPVGSDAGMSFLTRLMVAFGAGIFLSQFLINGLVAVRVRR